MNNVGIHAIWGAPRSGKTTLAVNLAHAISRSGKSVCLISPEPYSELSVIFGVSIPRNRSLPAAIRGFDNLKQTILKIGDLLYILAAPTNADAFDDSYSDEQVKLLLELCDITFDHVVVDCPSETNSLMAAWAMNKASSVPLCIGGQTSCAVWYSANARAIKALGNKVFYISTETTSDYDYNAMHELLEVSPAITIPHIAQATLLQNERRLIYGLTGKKGRLYREALSRIYEVINT
ncbi:MAG: hypothetical protein AB7C97_11835 [Oscillospiraceae bacterium]